MEAKRGKVITFYSYKGGTGRSMALANVACILSRRPDVKRGVLTIDWDLEAPGLHHFFRVTRPSVLHSEASPDPTAKGVIDLFEHLLVDSPVFGEKAVLTEARTEDLVRTVALSEFVVKTVVPKVDLMPAGRFDQNYAERVSAFDWRRSFHQAPSLIRILAEYFADQYDYVLIDSRTGLNDISGICTALLPDQVVFVFTPNRQSLLGGIEIIRKATGYRRQSDDVRPLAVFPLPSRIDVSEPELLEKWRLGDPDGVEDQVGYQSRFEKLFADIYDLQSCNLGNYFDEVQIQHVPRYSYGEDIAALVERGTRLSITRSYAAFASILADFESPWSVTSSRARNALPDLGTVVDSPKIQAVKEYLVEDRFKLKLHDLVTQEIREVSTKTRDEEFPVQAQWSTQEFVLRVHQYETVCTDLMRIQALLGFWADVRHDDIVSLSPKRLCDRIELKGGNSAWLALRWYPALLLLYSGGVAAVAANKYENLRKLMHTPVSPHPVHDDPTLIRSVGREMDTLHGAFKTLPGYEQRYTPRSDYLFQFLQPILDDLLFLSSDYEPAFDRFEVLYALEHAHRYTGFRGPWGPVGRFAWKLGRTENNPFSQVIAEATAGGALWPPVQAGLFGGSIERFKEVAVGYGQLIDQLGWL